MTSYNIVPSTSNYALTQNKLNYIRLNYVLKPRATNILRGLFKNHWIKAFKTDWTENDAKQFTEGTGKEIQTSSSRRDKMLLRSGRLDMWSLNLVGEVLFKFDFGKSFKPNKRVKSLIKTLLETYADINERPRRELSNEEFDSTWQIIENALIKLGDSTDQLKELKTEKLRSMEMKNRQKNEQSFRELGNKLYDQDKFTEAIMYYTQGIAIERCNIESAMLYSNRASAYLQSYKKFSFFVHRMVAAADDFTNAMELCPTWYRPYYKLGLMYEEMKYYKECVTFLEVALAFDPKNQTIKNKLNKVRIVDRPDRYERALERAKEDTLETVCRELLGAPDWSFEDHMDLLEDRQLCEELYSKAIESGNGRVMVDLAKMFQNGQLKWDPKKSVTLYEKVVSENKNTVNGNDEEIPPSADAAWHLGETFEKGLGVVVDLKAAITWYEKALDLGFAGGARSLGLLYLRGSGFERNEERGVVYFQLAAGKNFYNGYTSLCDYYFESELDADEALRLHRKVDAEYEKLKEISKKYKEEFHTFENDIDRLGSLVELDKISLWEEEKELSVEGLSVKERRWRYVYEKIPNMDEIEKKCNNLYVNCVENLQLFPSISVEQVLKEYRCPYNLTELKELVEESVSAKIVVKAVVHFGNALKCLNADSNSLPIRLCLITELSQCLQMEPSVAKWRSGDREKVGLIVDELLTEVGTMNSNIEIACFVCYSYFHADDNDQIENFLMECIKKYPEEIYFSKMFVNTMLCLGDYTQGLRECDKLLEKLPGDNKLLLNRAKLLQGLKEDPIEVIKAFEDFLLSAPKDHPDVPAAFYEIAIHYSELNRYETREKVKEYIRKGYEAEKSQLPCVLPYKFRKEFRFKELIQFAVRMKDLVPVNEEKLEKLMDPSRVESIVSYREKLANPDKIKEIEDCLTEKLEPRDPPQLPELKFVSLSEVKHVKDKFQEGFAVRVTIVEDHIVATFIHLLVEDEESDVSYVVIFNYNLEDEDEKKFAYGAEVVIMNPYVKSTEDGKTLIIIEDTKSLRFECYKYKVCRFCRSENAKKKCGKCMRVKYCAKQCQLKDWNVMKHKICCEK